MKRWRFLAYTETWVKVDWGSAMHYRLVVMRHGESLWNLENRFTGWSDVELSERGKEEALSAARLLRDKGFDFDLAFTSRLRRAIRTLWTVLDVLDRMWIPTECAWQLNERHYGILQGLNKAEMAERYGEAQVQIWRRAYAIAPDPLPPDDPRRIDADPRYADLAQEQKPRTECLKDTVARVVPYWNGRIAPALSAGRRVLIAAHGNSLRALIKHLEDMPEEEVVAFNIPTGQPMLIELDESMRLRSRQYLGDPDEIARAVAAVAAQASAPRTAR